MHTATNNQKIGLYTALAAAVIFSFCGDETDPPADFAGAYTLNVTNGPNSCPVAFGQQGETAQDIKLKITQDGDSATGTVEDIAGLALAFLTSDNIFRGRVSGKSVTMHLYGKNSFQHETCPYLVNVTFRGSISGDIISGSIEYIPSINISDPACATMNNCSWQQSFNGIRPPSI